MLFFLSPIRIAFWVDHFFISDSLMSKIKAYNVIILNHAPLKLIALTGEKVQILFK